MMEAGMQRTGVHQMGHPQLFDVSQPLKIGVFNKIKYQPCGDADKAVDRVVYDFVFLQWRLLCKNVK